MPKKPTPPRAPGARPARAAAVPLAPESNPPVDDPRLPYPIVAIGASAGGIEAIKELLAAIPADTGMAFVLLQHTGPDHDAQLLAVLGRGVKIPATTAADGVRVEPDRIYVAPAQAFVTYRDGALHVKGQDGSRTAARPVDVFMRSLAEHHGHQSIGVVLSGTLVDGTRGLDEIKGAGGITFAQDASAEQQGMPRSAIATGAVDFVLSAREIGEELARIARHPYIAPPAPDAEENAQDLQKVLTVLRGVHGTDFANYKRNTVERRVMRRMVLHKVQSLREYAELLQGNRNEVDALYQDILIGVTSFFRNPDAFEALKATVFPAITEGRSRTEQVRIWSPGCSTGEEAYSLAIAFAEYLEASGRRVGVQIFATDINGASIDKARAGIYARAIAQDVTPERLRRYFVEVDGSYRLSKQIRDCCVFARQDVLQDPPFSRIDLAACRNLLIYLGGSLQQRLIPLLHYALRDKGFLWLGNSETIGAYRDLFEAADAKHRIYAKRPGVTRPTPSPAEVHWAASRHLPSAAQRIPAIASGDPQKEADRLVLARYAPPGVLVDADMHILQFRGDTGPYLAPAPGKASLNLLKMLREGLGVGVRNLIQRALREDTAVREEGLRVRSDGGWRNVGVVAIPLKGASVAPGAVLVLFEEEDAAERARVSESLDARRAREGAAPSDGEKEAERLRQELAATREYLQSVIEQQEAANEELQSANEEVQSANEELQSINEELETSKEEIQSSNEELATVNDELHNRNLELSRSNDDLINLFASVNMPIVMLGPDLRIRRFTPPAEKLLNLIPADIGRPIADIKVGVGAENLEKMALDVIESVTVHESEVQDRAGRWHSMRVRPYRTLENRIDGVVILFVDVDNLKRAEQAVRESEARFELLADSAPVLIWMSDGRGLRFVNRAYENFVGALESDIRAGGWTEHIHPDDRPGYLASYEDAVRARQPFTARARFRRADGEYRWMKSVAMARLGSGGEFIGYVGATFDVTEVAETEAALVELERGKNEFLAMLAHELRNPLSGVRNASLLLRRVKTDPIVDEAREIIDRQTGQMVRMVDDLLDLTRITHGKIRVEPVPVDLCQVVRRVIEDTAPGRQAAHQEFAAEIPAEPLVVSGDAMRLAQVFANLLGNAAKFTPDGGRISLTVQREAASAAHGMAVVRVRDNGSGIDPALLPRIFDLFVQEQRPSRAGGIGLGLTLARRLAELHGGTIEAQSGGPGMGAEFTVRLPLVEAKVAPARAGSAAPAPPSRRVLIVDDNADSGSSLRTMLRMDGHEVELATDGTAALASARAMRPDVVLRDIGLPDMDGYEVARRLRADGLGRDPLIVATTGYGRSQDREKSARAGIDAHLTKPIDMEHLAQLLARGRRVPKG